ncbi:MAG: class I SAM-dependent methyltransferase [Gloeobacterales cyanobacterium]|jgi:SAM-dependent methyltransferase
MLEIPNKLYSKTQKMVEILNLYTQGKVYKGFCPICESNTKFIEKDAWLREYYYCSKCHSNPRQRELVIALNLFFPDWRNLKIHESSPGGASSEYLQKSCSRYLASQFYYNVELGQYKDGVRCENLEKMTFENCSFDLIITQDVFEHIMHPDAAFNEISRVLKPGGAHIFTIPWYPKLSRTAQRARLNNGKIEFLDEPVYHGNPIDAKGSLVTFDWGLDLTDFISKHSELFTTIYLCKDRKFGLDGEQLEVFISRKTAA